MTITEFGKEHIEAARQIALLALARERSSVPELPEAAPLPELANLHGVAATEGGELIGYMCAYPPRAGFFGTDVAGVWSPLHANGVVDSERLDRGKIISELYGACGEKWRSMGAEYHSVTIYAHDDELVGSLFDNGFGKRCIDAICSCAGGRKFDNIRELEPGESFRIRNLRRKLADHLTKSPCFMAETPEEWFDNAEKRNSRIFVREVGEKAVAFIEIGGDGENFLSASGGLVNICGAFCEPEFRGGGFMSALLDHVRGVLESEGNLRLGVDYESINPTALRFWKKRFAPYTFGLVRRIDFGID